MKKSIKNMILMTCLFYPKILTAQDFEENLLKERPVEIIEDVVRSKTIHRQQIVNLVSRFDPKKVNEKDYRDKSLLEGYLLSFEQDLNEDPFFYLWEDYKQGDFYLKNQFLSAAWGPLISRYELFKRIDESITTAKKITTIKTPRKYHYRLKINPELNVSNKLRIKATVLSKNNKLVDNLRFRLDEDKVEIGKEYSLIRGNKNSYLDVYGNYDYEGNYSLRLALKFSRWP